jgi:hypothetical protein
LAYVQALLATGISNSVRAAYWQKYFVHRAVRPEAYGGLAHHRLANGVSDYPLHDDFLNSEALDRSKARYGTYLLSQTYPEAAPLHSTYPGGATSVGAVTATILKAFFDESRVIANPVQPDPADPTRLVPYSGPPLTVGGELNKLAVNFGFGRNWAGIHWRSDASASMALGRFRLPSRPCGRGDRVGTAHCRVLALVSPFRRPAQTAKPDPLQTFRHPSKGRRGDTIRRTSATVHSSA